MDNCETQRETSPECFLSTTNYLRTNLLLQRRGAARALATRSRERTQLELSQKLFVVESQLHSHHCAEHHHAARHRVSVVLLEQCQQPHWRDAVHASRPQPSPDDQASPLPPQHLCCSSCSHLECSSHCLVARPAHTKCCSALPAGILLQRRCSVATLSPPRLEQL